METRELPPNYTTVKHIQDLLQLNHGKTHKTKQKIYYA